ncbi:AraC family transcriptional regulator [Silanimonas sp.]|uniref:AraC family transcriptional regulator n=1 Tax=Silanimonas sp. TaxID=1929290 RepID=UPI0022CD1A48|nr:AraC family transcriptional regulator [Silanimonas sp.]MCZ8165661.1 AraC family transcriptional regulator [Silanimonas sp.]
MSESPPIDLLSDLLGAYQLSAKVFAQPLVCGGWRIDTNGVATTQFHLLVRGTCFLQMAHLPRPLPMRPGDLVMVPNGDWHILSADPLAAADAHPASGANAALLCGALSVPEAGRKALFSLLPPALIVRASEANERFSHLVRLIVDEANAAEAGSRLLLDGLSNVLVTMTLREHFRHAPVTETRGVLAAAHDKRLGALISALHREPGRAWSVESMLELAPVSRSALMERFRQLVGDSPMGYVMQLRMIRAQQLLADPAVARTAVPGLVGYRNEAAFRRALRRFADGSDATAVDDRC